MVTDFNNRIDWLSRIAVQSDGKIVAIGTIFAGSKFALVRYNRDGTPDATLSDRLRRSPAIVVSEVAPNLSRLSNR